MEQVTTVDLMRHGACQGGEIFRGITDVPLSDAGWRQMRSALSGLSGWQRILCSPLQRCRAFAEEHGKQQGLPVVVNKSWREIHFGIWEGREISEVWQNDKETITRYFNDPGSITPQGGEAVTDARERLLKAWHAMLQHHRSEHILVVQHGGTIRLLLASLLNMPLKAITQFEVPYASITRIKVFHGSDGDKPVLVSHNMGL